MNSARQTLSELLVFTNRDQEWVVAHDAEDALGVWAEAMGECPYDYSEDRWSQVPGDRQISMWCDLRGDIAVLNYDVGQLVTKSAYEWIVSNGRGYLGGVNE